VRRLGKIVLLALALAISGSLACALGLQSAEVYMAHGSTLLLQARHTGDGQGRERLIAEAVAAFKAAYQLAGHVVQGQALVGAAQGYLLMQSPRPHFPFLWQATPLQRAEKSLQQALFLQPDNGAAVLLLALVYQRQAWLATAPQAESLQRSNAYLVRAAALGLPVRLSTDDTAPPGHLSIPLFDVRDTIVVLRYVDARGAGQTDDLAFIYCSSAAQKALFGVVVTAGKAYPLITDRTTGALAPASVLYDLAVVSQRDNRPILTVTVSQGAQRRAERFVWNSNGFVHLED
jgi:hypothetical protein